MKKIKIISIIVLILLITFAIYKRYKYEVKILNYCVAQGIYESWDKKRDEFSNTEYNKCIKDSRVIFLLRNANKK